MSADNAVQSKRRCGARARTTGEPCRSWGMANGRCRMHGGTNPGPPKGNRNALVHGRYTADEKQRRRSLRALIREMAGLVPDAERG